MLHIHHSALPKSSQITGQLQPLSLLLYFQGEAVAFALGGSRHLLRAQNNAALVNQDALAADSSAAAEVYRSHQYSFPRVQVTVGNLSSAFKALA